MLGKGFRGAAGENGLMVHRMGWVGVGVEGVIWVGKGLGGEGIKEISSDHISCIICCGTF